MAADETTAEDVDDRGEDRRQRDNDVVCADGNPNRHGGSQHRDDPQLADPEASQALKDAADAVVAEPFEVAAAVVAVVVASAVDAGDDAVAVDVDAALPGFRVIVWQPAVGADRGVSVGRTLFFTGCRVVAAGLLVAEISLEQEDRRGEQRDPEQRLEDRLRNDKGQQRAADNEGDRAADERRCEPAVDEAVLDERDRGARQPEGLADEPDLDDGLGLQLEGQQREDENEIRDEHGRAADPDRVDDGRPQQEEGEQPPELDPVAVTGSFG